MKATIQRFLPLVLAALLVQACVRIPKSPLQETKRVVVGPGTEDLVLDTVTGSPRLLISCDDRRNEEHPEFSGIVSYDLQTDKVDTLEIREYPFGLAFHPHGLDIQVVDGKNRLYVVCHDDSAGHHWIACFEIAQNELFWLRNYHAGFLTSPNAVTALPDGSLYVNNDHAVRNSFKEMIWKQEKCEIIRFEPDASHKVAYKGLAYGNGITFKDSTIYAAATRRNAVYSFQIRPDGSLANRQRIAKLRGPDNLRWDGEDILVACHLKPFKFIGHAKDPNKHSPTVVYRIQLDGSKPKLEFADKGKKISAGATGLKYGNRLFIGQVFENWILECRY